MSSGKYTFSAPAALMRRSISAWMRSQMAYPYGRMTIVPRTGPVSASVAFASTSWYQRGKSAACEVSTPDTRWRLVRHDARGPRRTP